MGGLLFVLVVSAYWRIVLTDEFTWLDSPDLAYQVLPWFQMQASEWHAGRFPMWDPYHWAGQPLLGQAQPGAAYPLNWILFSLPLHDGWISQAALHWYLVLLHFIAAWGAYLLARELRCSRGASLIAAIVYSLSGWMATFDWPQMVNGAIWIPFVLRFLVRVVRGERVIRSAILAGFFLGFAWLSGHHQIPIFASLASAGIWIWVLASRRFGWRRLAAACALFWVMAMATGALQILPAREYGKLSLRWVGASEPLGWETKVPYSVHRQWSLPPVNVLGIVLPGLWALADPYLGLTALTLALLGVAMSWQQREVKLFGALALGGLFYAFGAATIFEGLVYSVVPLVDKARSASFAIILFGLGVAILAAIGADSIMRDGGHPAVRRAVWILCGAAAFILLVRLALVLSKPFDANFDARHVIVALTGLLLAALLAGAGRGTLTERAATVGLVLLIMIELSLSLGFSWRSREDRNRPSMLAGMAENSDIVLFLRRQPGPFRVDVDSQLIPYNFGDWHGIQQMGGYLASITSNIYRFEAHNPAERRLLGVEYAIRKTPDEFYSEEVFAGASGLKVFRNRTVYPRAWSVHKATLIGDRKLAPKMLAEPGADWRQETLVTAPAPPLETCAAPDSVNLLSYSPHLVSIRVNMSCRGMLILADTYFPGWKVSIDGKPAAAQETYTALRGVAVDRGDHVVEFRYRPQTVILGGVLTALGFAAALAAWLSRRGDSLPRPA